MVMSEDQQSQPPAMKAIAITIRYFAGKEDSSEEIDASAKIGAGR
jgi:hypothetical protein